MLGELTWNLAEYKITGGVALHIAQTMCCHVANIKILKVIHPYRTDILLRHLEQYRFSGLNPPGNNRTADKTIFLLQGLDTRLWKIPGNNLVDIAAQIFNITDTASHHAVREEVLEVTFHPLAKLLGICNLMR